MGHLLWVSAERKRAAWKRGRGFSPLFFILLSREKGKGKITCDLVHLLLYRNSYMWFLVIVLEVNGDGKRKGRVGTREKEEERKGSYGKGYSARGYCLNNDFSVLFSKGFQLKLIK